MDIMIPYLRPIIRLTPESKGAFHIAGVKQSAEMSKVELEERKKREIEKQKKITYTDGENKNKKNSAEDDEQHLDTWA